MRDVAARAGVSPMTVSRTLRGDERVAPERRERVLAAVAALSYRTNDVARSLRAGRAAGLVGLAVTNLANPFYSQFALGVESEAALSGYRVLLGNTSEDVERERRLVEDLASRRVEGLVVVPASARHEHLDPAGLQGMPVVVATSPALGPSVDAVVLDDEGGTRAALGTLLDEGHRRIGFVGLPQALWTGRERLRGYRAAHAERGLDVDPALVRAVDPVTSEDAVVAELMATVDPPTAVFAANGTGTVAVCRWVRRHRRDLRVAGFDDVATADLFALPLTLVTYSPQELGRQAARLLLDRVTARVDADAPARTVVVPTGLRSY